MCVLEDHYKGKPTIIIHDRIINGCQNFTLEEADKVVKEYEVSEEQWNQVLEIRRNVAKYGNDKHRDVLINDEDVFTRKLVAQYGNDKHRDVLLNDKCWYVRQTVAQYGNDNHRNILSGDDYWYVRAIALDFMGK